MTLFYYFIIALMLLMYCAFLCYQFCNAMPRRFVQTALQIVMPLSLFTGWFVSQLRKDYEEEKQVALGRALTSAQRDAENIKLQTEVKCKEEYIEEAKKLTEKHKREVSLAKKKQWVRDGTVCTFVLVSCAVHII